MQSECVVSINLITYNRRALLERCLNSIFRQTFTNFNIIIIDDGSTDGTRSYIESLNEPRIAYHALPHTGNIAKLRNTALRKSAARYIAWIDSDDEWEETKLAAQIGLMKQSDAAFSFTNAAIVRDGTPSGTAFSSSRQFVQTEIISQLFTDWCILPSTIIFKRQCLERVGFLDESLLSAADPEFILRLVHLGGYEVLPEPLATRYLHSDNHSAQNDATAYREMIDIAKHHLNNGILSSLQFHRIASTLNLRLGVVLRDLNERDAARDAYIQSLKLFPFNIRSAFHLIWK